MAEDHVAAVRQFNRFHTRLVGALDDRLLASDYSLPQTRLLYEIAHASAESPLTAADLARDLGLDPGYVSRLVADLGRRGLIERRPDPTNARRRALGLTPHGRTVFAELDRAAAAEVRSLLAPLAAAEQAALTGAMRRIRRLLGDAPKSRPFVLRDPRPGDLGWIVHRQAVLYNLEYGWDWTFEALLAQIVSAYVADHRPGRERCWIAERDGEIVGAVFVVRHDDTTAKLRLLYVEPNARGHGLGRQLVGECLRFAQGAGYHRLTLWTNDVLTAARRLYEAAGFELIEEQPHHSFGRQLVGQTWTRNLRLEADQPVS